MRRTLAVLTVVALLSGCAGTICKEQVGLPRAACEVRAVVDTIEAQQPMAFAVLDSLYPVVTPDVRVRIDQLRAAWPPLQRSMDGLVATLDAGGEGDIPGVIGNAITFYLDLSALVVQLGGQALPGLPRTVTVNAVVQ